MPGSIVLLLCWRQKYDGNMLAEFEVEIGGASPTLSVPWADERGLLAYFDLRQNSALVDDIPESRDVALRNALLRLNAPTSPFLTAKCDLWTTQELSDEEVIFRAGWKHASYIDLLWRDPPQRTHFGPCEAAMRAWIVELRKSPIESASAAIILRRCNVWNRAGYYWTVYLSGFGDTGISARDLWAAALEELLGILLPASYEADQLPPP
ncbi:MAG: hypothetical protein ABI383_14140 [Acidobacteriaceae bacterium]